jgi:RNA polymerase sigma-B factor
MTSGGEDIHALFVVYRQTRDRAVRDRLVDTHLPLATHLARRFDRRGEALDDLIQVASLGLLKAIDRFDPGRGLEFSTFAVPTIVGELKRHFRDRAWSVRLPRRLQELNLELGTALAELTHELRRSPTLPELAARVGESIDDVLEAMEAGLAYRSDSLDAPTAGGGDGDPGNPIASRLGTEDPMFQELIDHAEIHAVLNELPERERTIVVLRFFAGLTQAEIGERIGISQMHVSRLLTRTLEQLRQRFSATMSDPE